MAWEDCGKIIPKVGLRPAVSELPRVMKGHPAQEKHGVFIMDGGIDRVWRLKPTAESLGISTKTLQRLVARGAITTVQISDRIKGITESERRRFIESRTGGA